MTSALSIPTDALSDAQALVLLREMRRALTHAEQFITDRHDQPLNRMAILPDLERLGMLKVFGAPNNVFVVMDVDGALAAWRIYAEQLSGACL